MAKAAAKKASKTVTVQQPGVVTKKVTLMQQVLAGQTLQCFLEADQEGRVKALKELDKLPRRLIGGVQSCGSCGGW